VQLAVFALTLHQIVFYKIILGLEKFLGLSMRTALWIFGSLRT